MAPLAFAHVLMVGAAESAPRRPAVFVDRDGTINRKRPEGDYVTSPEELELLPGAAEGIRLLNESGFKVVVVTNQRGIALGRMTEDDLERVHARMLAELAGAGASVDAIYHCPHDRDECDCRKPEIGLVLRAWKEHDDLQRDGSVVVGDSLSDVEVGSRLGLRTILVGEASDGALPPEIERAPSLLAAARRISEASR